MKKLCILLICLLAPISVWAQTMVTANQVTVAWDVVAPIATGDTIKYQVYTRGDLVSTGTKVGNEITITTSLLTFNVEGKYFIGVILYMRN